MSNEKREKHWALLKELRPYRVPSEVTSEAVFLFLQSLDCPRALTVGLLYQYGEHGQLAALTFDPLHYRSLVEVRDAYAATAFLSKAKFLNLGYDLDDRALEKFEKFEFFCKQTNRRFSNLAHDPLFTGHAVWLHNAVVRKISKIVGAIGYDDLVEAANWGPGSSTVIPRRHASSSNKFQFETGITRRLLNLFPLEAFRGCYPGWFCDSSRAEFAFQLESGNKVTTVEKDATANRVIAIEPGFNLWFQKAIGLYLRKRLLLFGVDLNFQSKNQFLAYLGSKDLKLATIDFSSASDSISHNVVRDLLPSRLFALMDACRSHVGVSSGDPDHFKGSRVWEKFSSMGNGFTFELESLIFFATALCCAEYLQVQLSRDSGLTVSVYGDDVIIPVDCLELFAEMCLFYGFTMNKKKSHFASCFRESCGKHYYSGLEVTPIYLKDRLSTIPAVFRFANAVRRLAHRRNYAVPSCDVSLKPVFDYLVSVVPAKFRLRIDESLGDGGFIGNFDEATPKRARWGVEGYLVTHLTDKGKTFKSGVHGLLLSHLWALERRGLSTSLFRNRVIQVEKVAPLKPKGNVLAPNWREYVTPWGFTRLHPFVLSERLREIVGIASGDRPEMNNDVSVPGKSRMKFSLGLVAQWYDLGPWL
jgi:hypothetical protein